MKKIFIFFYVCTATVLKAQVPNFVVKDLQTNKPIQFVAITSQKGRGTYTDESGEFNYSFSKNDTILISHLSYNPLKVTYFDLLNLPNNRVLLSPKVIILQEALVKPSGSKLTLLGYYDEKTFFKRVGPGGQSEFELYVNHIKNVSGIEGYLKNYTLIYILTFLKKVIQKYVLGFFRLGRTVYPKMIY